MGELRCSQCVRVCCACVQVFLRARMRTHNSDLIQYVYVLMCFNTSHLCWRLLPGCVGAQSAFWCVCLPVPEHCGVDTGVESELYNVALVGLSELRVSGLF